MSRVVILSVLLVLAVGGGASAQDTLQPRIPSTGALEVLARAAGRGAVPDPAAGSGAAPSRRDGGGVASWLGYTLPRQRGVLAYEVRRAVHGVASRPLPGPRAGALAGGAVLLVLLPALLLLQTRRGTAPSEALSAGPGELPRTERARRLLEGGVQEVDAAREAHMARDGLEILLRLSEPVGSAGPDSPRPWGAAPAEPPREARPRATYGRPR